MPEIGKTAGEDNVTSDRYTMDLGVEPDLGNLLQNIQLANDLLDSAEQKFVAIGEVVNTTTQRLAAMTRQTELAVAQATRLQNSYQGIASASMAMGNLGQIGGMAGGMMPGQYPGMPYMPGQGAFQGMGMPAMEARSGGGMPAMFPEDEENLNEYAPPPPTESRQFPLSGRAYFLEQLGEKVGPGQGGKLSQLRAGWAIGRKRLSPEEAFAKYSISTGIGGGSAPPMPISPKMPTAGVGTMPEALIPPGVAEAGMGEEAGLLAWGSSLGAGAGRTLPWLAAAYGGYKAVSKAIADTTRLSGMTGGTGLITSTTGGFGQSYLGLGGQRWGLGLTNPSIGVAAMGRIQEEILQNGYIGGPGGLYGGAVSYMMEAYRRGMGETVDQLDLYREAIDRSGGSVSSLVNAMDVMRNVASTTNASLTAMAKNYKSQVETFVNMGFSGTGAVYGGTIMATAYADNRYGGLSPVLRNFPGLDIENPVIMAGIASQAGIPYSNVMTEGFNNPEYAQNFPVYAENAAIHVLRNMGFEEGMSPAEIGDFINNHGGTFYLQALQAQGALPRGVNTITDAVSSIATAFTHPMRHAVARGREQLSSRRITRADLDPISKGGFSVGLPIIGDINLDWLAGPSIGVGPGPTSRSGVIESYVRDKLGLNTSDPGTVGSWYSNYLDDHNMKNIPVLDKLLEGGQDINATYLKVDGGPGGSHLVPMNVALKDKALRKSLLDGSALIVTADKQEQNALSSHKVGSRIRQAAVDTLLTQASTEQQIMSRNPDGSPARTAPNANAGTVDLAERTIHRLSYELGEAIAKAL